MDEIKSNKKAFGIYLGEPSTEPYKLSKEN